jgi:hypothetical protein
MSLKFNHYIGIDYSGAKKSDNRLSSLKVYSSKGFDDPVIENPPSQGDNIFKNWSRKEVADYIINIVSQDKRIIIGVDHCFSFPMIYLKKNRIQSWDHFILHFSSLKFVNKYDIDVEGFKSYYKNNNYKYDLRLTEKWTSSAKSVFLFGFQGSVANSTHTGLLFLNYIRKNCREKLHFWPFDGWVIPENKSVIAEVYPSIFHNRYPKED